MFMASQVRITALESDMTSLQREVKFLKETVNMREQQTRSLSVRIVGLPNSEDEHVPKLIYDRILKPMLVVAKERNLIAAVPQMATVISDAYRIRPRGGATAAGSHPIRVKISSPSLKSALFRVKKDALPHLTEAEKSAGSKHLLMVEELTTPTYNFLKQLRGDSRVARAWTVEGRIKFVKAGDSGNTVRSVSSIFDNPDSILG